MFRASLISAITAILVMAVNFLVSVVTARSLGPEGRGAFYSLQVFALFVASCAQLGLGQAMVYAVRAKIVNFRVAYDTSSAVTTALSVCMAIAAFSFFLKEETTEIWMAACYAAAVSLTVFCGFCAQLESSLRAYNTARLALPVLVLLSLAAVAATDSMNLSAAIAIQALATLLVASGTWAYLRWKLRRTHDESISAKDTKPPGAGTSLVKLGLKFHATTLAGILATNIDKIYLISKATASELGIYSIAFSTSRILSSLYESMATSLYSRYGGHSDPGSTDVVVQVFRATFIPMMALAILGGFIGQVFIPLIFGHKFSGAAIPFAILLIESILSGSSWMLAQKFNIDGKPGLVAIRQIASIAPILIAMPFLPHQNLISWLAFVMAISGGVRLGLTIFFMMKMEKSSLRDLTPTISESMALINKFRRKGSFE